MTDGVTEPVDFRLLFEKSRGLYLVLNPDMTIVAASDAYCSALSISRGDILGRNLYDAFPVPPENLDGHNHLRASLNRVVTLKRPDMMGIERFDVPNKKGDALEERYWSPRNSPVLDQDGKLRWIINRIEDVTHAVREPNTERSQQQIAYNNRRLIVELQRRNEEAEEIDRMRGELLAVSRQSTMALVAGALAHDVTQPLTAAMGYLTALRRGRSRPDFDAKAADGLMARIAEQFERSGEVVQALRALIAAGSAAHRPVQIDDLVTDARRLTENAMRVADATLVVSVEPGLPAISMDRAQIQQAVVNLLVHAARNVSGKPERNVVLRVARKDDRLSVSVSDTGGGMSAEEIRRVTGPLATGDLEGRDLELPIARQAAKAHGGTMTIDGTPAGSVITIAIPL
ncbi:MAG: PAS domain-containing protein [Proteobacteria bacterium]|nr:PAS domain-containing protein [Pseudomonadota bacterium]